MSLAQYHLLVTDKHLRTGTRSSPAQCAIALAWREKFPTKHIHVGSTYVLIDNKEWRHSEDTIRMIEDFDKKRRTKSFTAVFEEV